MKRRISNGEFAAIVKGLETGLHLKVDIPQIADDYMGGLTAKEISKKYNISSRYKVGERIAPNAVINALKGHDGGYGVDLYEGLIDKSVFYRQSSFNQSTLFRRTKERIRKDCSNGGYESYIRGVGVHAITKEQQRKTGINLAIKKGQVPWIERQFFNNYCVLSEQEWAYKLKLSSRTYKSIAECLNEDEYYHKGNVVRTSKSAEHGIARFKKMLKEGNFSITTGQRPVEF